MAERRQAGTSGNSEKQAPVLEGQEEARRILERLERESSATQSMVQRGLSRTASHLSAQDADKDDHIEVWATRIGRMLGLLITSAIIVWLILYLMQG
ncbi:hypothetical protein KUG47_15095 [Falsochrobactrum sp. TDYN1]|uniref:Uncharacterized protein n=1 Tax=Falsochrobactrum tianjinense TaxID=2706015 RepID=A0A949UUE5_9HYPH|nr:hypothetical protein [Falsochrobactrum sp. TDYN1]MBV2144825.1 hypothetical protein [Falsochrobactrum sp. TDYN1]